MGIIHCGQLRTGVPGCFCPGLHGCAGQEFELWHKNIIEYNENKNKDKIKNSVEQISPGDSMCPSIKLLLVHQFLPVCVISRRLKTGL